MKYEQVILKKSYSVNSETLTYLSLYIYFYLLNKSVLIVRNHPGKNGALHSLKYCKFAKPVNLQFAKLVGFRGDNKQKSKLSRFCC